MKYGLIYPLHNFESVYFWIGTLNHQNQPYLEHKAVPSPNCTRNNFSIQFHESKGSTSFSNSCVWIGILMCWNNAWGMIKGTKHWNHYIQMIIQHASICATMILFFLAKIAYKDLRILRFKIWKSKLFAYKHINHYLGNWCMRNLFFQ